MAIDLIKQQTLDADTKAIHQFYFTGNLAPEGNSNTGMFFIIKKIKETILDFVKVL